MAHGVVARADAAEKAGKYAEAEELYSEHLAVVPDDVEVQLKYAEAILKADGRRSGRRRRWRSSRASSAAIPGREDVRRRAAELAVEIGAAYREGPRPPGRSC